MGWMDGGFGWFEMDCSMDGLGSLLLDGLVGFVRAGLLNGWTRFLGYLSLVAWLVVRLASPYIYRTS